MFPNYRFPPPNPNQDATNNNANLFAQIHQNIANLINPAGLVPSNVIPAAGSYVPPVPSQMIYNVPPNMLLPQSYPYIHNTMPGLVPAPPQHVLQPPLPTLGQQFAPPMNQFTLPEGFNFLQAATNPLMMPPVPAPAPVPQPTFNGLPDAQTLLALFPQLAAQTTQNVQPVINNNNAFFNQLASSIEIKPTLPNVEDIVFPTAPPRQRRKSPTKTKKPLLIDLTLDDGDASSSLRPTPDMSHLNISTPSSSVTQFPILAQPNIVPKPCGTQHVMKIPELMAINHSTNLGASPMVPQLDMLSVSPSRQPISSSSQEVNLLNSFISKSILDNVRGPECTNLMPEVPKLNPSLPLLTLPSAPLQQPINQPPAAIISTPITPPPLLFRQIIEDNLTNEAGPSEQNPPLLGRVDTPDDDVEPPVLTLPVKVPEITTTISDSTPSSSITVTAVASEVTKTISTAVPSPLIANVLSPDPVNLEPTISDTVTKIVSTLPESIALKDGSFRESSPETNNFLLRNIRENTAELQCSTSSIQQNPSDVNSEIQDSTASINARNERAERRSLKLQELVNEQKAEAPKKQKVVKKVKKPVVKTAKSSQLRVAAVRNSKKHKLNTASVTTIPTALKTIKSEPEPIIVSLEQPISSKNMASDEENLNSVEPLPKQPKIVPELVACSSMEASSSKMPLISMQPSSSKTSALTVKKHGVSKVQKKHPAGRTMQTVPPRERIIKLEPASPEPQPSSSARVEPLRNRTTLAQVQAESYSPESSIASSSSRIVPKRTEPTRMLLYDPKVIEKDLNLNRSLEIEYEKSPGLNTRCFVKLMTEIGPIVHNFVPGIIIKGVNTTVHLCGTFYKYMYEGFSDEIISFWPMYTVSAVLTNPETRTSMPVSNEMMEQWINKVKTAVSTLKNIELADDNCPRERRLTITHKETKAQLSVLFDSPISIKRTFLIKSYCQIDSRITALTRLLSNYITKNYQLYQWTTTPLCYLVIAFMLKSEHVKCLHEVDFEFIQNVSIVTLGNVPKEIVAKTSNKEKASDSLCFLMYKFAEFCRSLDFSNVAIDISKSSVITSRELYDVKPVVIRCNYSGKNLAAQINQTSLNTFCKHLSFMITSFKLGNESSLFSFPFKLENQPFFE